MRGMWEGLRHHIDVGTGHSAQPPLIGYCCWLKLVLFWHELYCTVGAVFFCGRGSGTIFLWGQDIPPNTLQSATVTG